MGDDMIPAGEAYAYALLEKWGEIIELSEIFRQNTMAGRIDNEKMHEYISKLVGLWNELSPKISNREDLGADFVRNFEKFEVYYQSPKLLLTPEHIGKVAELHKAVRMALEKTKVTQFERA